MKKRIKFWKSSSAIKTGGINNGDSCVKTNKGSKNDEKTKTQVYKVLNDTIKV